MGDPGGARTTCWPARSPNEAERKGLRAHPHPPFRVITWRVAAGGGPAAGGGGPGREGEGTQQVEESAGRCGVTMTTGPEAAREVTGTRLALSHVSSDAGVGLRLAPPPTRAGPRAAAGCFGGCPAPALPPSAPMQIFGASSGRPMLERGLGLAGGRVSRRKQEVGGKGESTRRGQQAQPGREGQGERSRDRNGGKSGRVKPEKNGLKN